MARAMGSALGEILPARRMWNRGSEGSTLPISVRDQGGPRKRIASISMGDGSRSESSWSCGRTRPSGGECASSLWKWWEWGWGWISCSSRNMCRDVRMGAEDDRESMLACGRAISWKHLFFKLRAEFRKMIQSRPTPAPHRFKYDAFSYAQNFDDGEWQRDREAQPVPSLRGAEHPSADRPDAPGIRQPGS